MSEKITCPLSGCNTETTRKNVKRHMSKCKFKENGLKANIQGNDKKRKYEKIEEVEEVKIFMDKMSIFFKDMEEKMCAGIPEKGIYCSIVNIRYGLSGGDKTHCKKHKGKLKALDKQCVFKECNITGKNIIGGKKFCATHRDDLISKGLPCGEEYVKKEPPPTCSGNDNGVPCDIRPSFDKGKFCKKHSISGISDDKRSCEINDENCKKRDGTNAQNSRPIYGLSGETPTRCSYILQKTSFRIRC